MDIRWAAGQTPLATPAASVDVSAAAGSPASADGPPGAAAAAGTTPPRAAATAPETELPLFLKPYSVAVSIGFDGPSLREAGLRTRLVSDIRSGLERMYGSLWKSKIEASDWLIPAGIPRLQRLTEAELIPGYPELTAEKVILIAITANQGLFEIGCREFDTRVQELSPLLTRTTHDVVSVPALACQLARDSFRPVLMFQGPSINRLEMEFHLQGGLLVPPDPTAAQLASGDVLRTFIRQMDRRNPGTVKFLQRLDLCYIRITSFNEPLATTVSDADQDVNPEGAVRNPEPQFIDRGHVRGVMIAHGAVPFGGKGRNLQQIGLRQRPSASSSRVQMVLKNRPDRPLICYRVDRVSKLRQTDVNENPPVRMLTDRNGEVEIAVDPTNPTWWLYVYSGSMLLARVPYAPGLIPQDVMKLPDDSIRLGVEGELYLLRDEIIDLVAEKAVYLSLARKAAAAGDRAGVEAAVASLDALPAQKYFDSELNRIRAPAVLKAEEQNNKSAKSKVEKLCTKMGESLTAFFSTEKRLKDAQEIAALRESVGATPPAESPN